MRKLIERSPRRGRLRTQVLALVATLGLVVGVASPAQAYEGDNSNASASLVGASLLGEDLSPIIELLTEASNNGTPDGEVNSALGIDVADLISADIEGIQLFADNGIIDLALLGQYARAGTAGDDPTDFVPGVSYASAGAIGADGAILEIPGESDPSETGVEISVDTADLLGGPDLVNLGVSVGVLASNAQLDEVAGGGASGSYVLEDLSIDLGGTLVGGVADTVDAVLDVAVLATALLAPTVSDELIDLRDDGPLSDGTVSITLDDLLDVAGVGDLDSLPAGTDLAQYVPAAVGAALVDLVDDVIAAVNDIVDGVPGIGAIVTTLLDGLGDVVATAVPGVITALEPAVEALIQLPAGAETEDEGAGTWTKTALGVGLGPDGSLAQVQLASSTVGPNQIQEWEPVLTADPNPVEAGTSVTIDGEGYPGNTEVEVTITDVTEEPTVVTTDDEGTFTVVVEVPEGTEADTYTAVGSVPTNENSVPGVDIEASTQVDVVPAQVDDEDPPGNGDDEDPPGNGGDEDPPGNGDGDGDGPGDGTGDGPGGPGDGTGTGGPGTGGPGTGGPGTGGPGTAGPGMTGSLADTGGSPLPLALAALLLVGAGVIVVAATTARRQTV